MASRMCDLDIEAICICSTPPSTSHPLIPLARHRSTLPKTHPPMKPLLNLLIAGTVTLSSIAKSEIVDISKYPKTIQLACIGDSITQGAGADPGKSVLNGMSEMSVSAGARSLKKAIFHTGMSSTTRRLWPSCRMWLSLCLGPTTPSPRTGCTATNFYPITRNSLNPSKIFQVTPRSISAAHAPFSVQVTMASQKQIFRKKYP